MINFLISSSNNEDGPVTDTFNIRQVDLMNKCSGITNWKF